MSHTNSTDFAGEIRDRAKPPLGVVPMMLLGVAMLMTGSVRLAPLIGAGLVVVGLVTSLFHVWVKGAAILPWSQMNHVRRPNGSSRVRILLILSGAIFAICAVASFAVFLVNGEDLWADAAAITIGLGASALYLSTRVG